MARWLGLTVCYLRTNGAGSLGKPTTFGLMCDLREKEASSPSIPQSTGSHVTAAHREQHGPHDLCPLETDPRPRLFNSKTRGATSPPNRHNYYMFLTLHKTHLTTRLILSTEVTCLSCQPVQYRSRQGTEKPSINGSPARHTQHT